MLGIIAIGAGVAVGGLLAYAASRPDEFGVQRSQEMQAPAERIFDKVQDFHAWSAWSPYEKLDPALKRTYSGSERGTGAAYAWDGNNKAGEGRMEIMNVVPGSKVTIKLDFTRPFEGHNTTEFLMEPRGNMTRVTWAMHGKQKFMMKLFSVFMNMDNLVGKDFAEGLSNLKRLVETKAVATT